MQIDSRSVPRAALIAVAGLIAWTNASAADLVSRRFWFYYWKMFGAPSAFDIEIAGRDGVRHIPGSSQLPRLLADEKIFERQFRLQFVAGQDAAILTLGSFAWPDKQQFLDFMHDAFSKMHAAHSRTLIIDLRDNGGGARFSRYTHSRLLPGESAPAGCRTRTAAKYADKDLLTRCRFRHTPNP
jgi:hypothetical protein